MGGCVLVGLLFVCVLILVGCGSGRSERVEKLKGNPGKIIGHLKWTITETATGRIMGTGERDVRIGDATVRTVSAPQFGDLQQLIVPLGDHFTMGLAQGPDASGFGVTADRDDQRTFCWEWFIVDGQTAAKLQESGEIAVQLSGNHIARAEFATDVSLRVTPMAELVDPTKPLWRVSISKGSFLSWPGWPDD